MARPRTRVPALDRGLDVLEYMADTGEALTLTEIARNLGRTVSEVQRTVAGLCERGYLVRDRQNAYRLSSKLFRIASAFPPFRDLVARALVPMQEFADRTYESVHLCVLSDDQLVLIAQNEGRGFVRISLQLGAVQDPAHTVSGRILLAGLTEPELEAFMSRGRMPRPERAELVRRCERIKKQGYDYAPSHRFEGVHDLGVPITMPDSQVVAALTTSWLPPRGRKTSPLELLRPLKETALKIARSYEPAA
jgi:DNA-binding IclR family transcriptional regulator